MKLSRTIALSAIAFAALLTFAATDSFRLDDRELGIGEYGDHASVDSFRLNDRELGIGEYGDHA